MKKVLLFFSMCLMTLTMHAQKCAVLDFQIGTGVNEEEIDALTYNFRANFNIDGYRIIPKEPMYSAIERLGLNRTDMTQQQMLYLGRQLEAKLIVVGTMNKFMGEYSVDIRALDVSTGVTCAAEGATFDKSNYRATMENLATRLSEKLANPNSSEVGTSAGSQRAQKVVPQGYTDLGLPSGTLWRNYNCSGYYSFNEAISSYGDYLPTKEQLIELTAECQWTWTGSGYKVVGPNGNSITFPVEGYRNTDGGIGLKGVQGEYWSSTPSGSDTGWFLLIKNDGSIKVLSQERKWGDSVRLVKKL